VIYQGIGPKSNVKGGGETSAKRGHPRFNAPALAWVHLPAGPVANRQIIGGRQRRCVDGGDDRDGRHRPSGFRLTRAFGDTVRERSVGRIFERVATPADIPVHEKPRFRRTGGHRSGPYEASRSAGVPGHGKPVWRFARRAIGSHRQRMNHSMIGVMEPLDDRRYGATAKVDRPIGTRINFRQVLVPVPVCPSQSALVARTAMGPGSPAAFLSTNPLRPAGSRRECSNHRAAA